MTKRYFVADLPESGGPVQLHPDEAGHAAKVMRASVGDEIELFDGCGHQASAVIQAINKRSCLCVAAPYENVDRESAVRLHLGVALPKPDRAKELVERLTELGVAHVTPIICQRTQRPPSAGLIKKLNRIVVEACKQSRRNVLMTIESPVQLPFFANASREGVCVYAHPGGTSISQFFNGDDYDAVTAIVGPEGGFSDFEVEDLATSGFQAIDLGKRILRIETAAAVIAAQFG